MASQNIDNISDSEDLICSLCHQMFKDPVLLQSCGHNFCRVCIQKEWSTGEGGSNGGEKLCPTCKQKCPTDNYARNRALSSLVERIKGPVNKEVHQQNTEDVSEDLTCSLCHQMFKDPVLLQSCGHNFCRVCIQKEWSTEEGGSNGGEKLCPTCKQKCPTDNYAPNRALSSLVERIRGPVNQVEEQIKEDAKHECEEHKERISLFCLDDQTLCCLVCRDSIHHVGHDFLPLQEASALIKMKLSLHIDQRLRSLVQVTQTNQKQKEKIEAHKVEKMYLSHHITGEFEKLHSFLNDTERGFQQELDTQYDAILRDMEKNMDNLIAKQEDLQKNLDQCLKRGVASDIGILQGIREFMSQTGVNSDCLIVGNIGIVRYRNDTRSVCKVVQKTLSRGQFKGPLQYDTWKKMRSVVKPVTTSLTLDPETAHRSLILSEDLTSISYKPRLFRTVPYSPKRYTHMPIALTKEGFNEGRHYWEVDVDGKDIWFTGLAKESVNRQQVIGTSVQGDYWAICHQSPFGLHIVDDISIPLKNHSAPKRVGIYLDYEGGQVSFYDAHTMTHLHTFITTFTEKLYPYFVPGSPAHREEVPMKIVHVLI